jgi:hypothetical protein
MKLAEIHTKKGVMKIKFFEEDAPNTVKNFITLAEKGFYNGLIFHRVIPFQRWYFGMESFYGLEGSLNTQYAGIGMVRLLNSKTKQLIWAHEYKTGFFHPTQSVIDRVADQVADKLLGDAIRAEGTNHRSQ